MVGFSRKMICITFCVAVFAAGFFAPSHANALVFAFSPEAGFQTLSYRNSQSEKSPYQGYAYGLGLDLKTGGLRSRYQLMLCGFWNMASLTNTAATSETQTQNVLGLGVGFALRRLKTRGGLSWISASDTYGSTVTPLTSRGFYLSGGFDVYDNGYLQMELGTRYENYQFATGTANPALGASLISEGYVFYFTFSYQIGAKIDAGSPWKGK